MFSKIHYFLLIVLSLSVCSVSLAETQMKYTLKGFDQVRGKRTGFFHVQEIDSVWWVIDPNGQATFINGVGVFRPQGWSYRRDDGKEVYPYEELVLEKFGSHEGWAEDAAKRLNQWGFNAAMTYSSGTNFGQPFAFASNLSMGNKFRRSKSIPENRIGHMLNMFSPDWPKHCAALAKKFCVLHRNNPWFLGYFMDNELPWPAPDVLISDIMLKSAKHSAKKALLEAMEKRFKAITRFNKTWGTDFKSFDDLAQATVLPSPESDEGRQFILDFYRHAADTYFSVATDAIRKVDPNHMIIGVRDAKKIDIVLEEAGRNLDIYSFNQYPRIDVERGVPESLVESWEYYHRTTGLPVMLTEWSFPAVDAPGLAATDGGGMRVANQAERAKCYRMFAETVASQTYMVGQWYFCWSDFPRERGILRVKPPHRVLHENSNYGLVNQDDEPWEKMVATATEVNHKLNEIHLNGSTSPYVYRDTPLEWNVKLPRKKSGKIKQGVETKLGNMSIKPGKQGWAVRLNGTYISAFQPMVQQMLDTGRRWQRAANSEIVAHYQDRRLDVYDVVYSLGDGELKGADDLNKATTAAAPFEMLWRFWVPRSGEQWFVAECISVKNTGGEPWQLEQVYHSMFPNIQGGEDTYRQYLGDRDNWSWESADAGLGVTTMSLDKNVNASYSVLKKKNRISFHPNWRYLVYENLAPGEVIEVNDIPTFHYPYERVDTASCLMRHREVRREIEAFLSP